VLPGEGDVARAWLGPATAFARVGGAGAGERDIGVYTRRPGDRRTNGTGPRPRPLGVVYREP
jgi:hypothetical protein